jgi:hypothetical protein
MPEGIPMDDSRLQSALQSTLFWGCLCMVATIVLTVVAVMIHDFRWILVFAWPFAGVAVWEIARVIFTSRFVVRAITAVATVISGAMLLWLYAALAPIELPGSIATESPKAIPLLTPSLTKIITSTSLMAGYQCKTDGIVPTQKKMDKTAENFKKYIERYAGIFGFKATIQRVEGGNKAELIPDLSIYLHTRETFPRKITLDIRRIGKNIVGVYSGEFIDNWLIQYFVRKPLVPDSRQETDLRSLIEDLAEVNKGDCELL